MKHRAVRNILLFHWDPIRILRRGGRTNEYDSYIPTLRTMMNLGLDAKAFEEYLDEVINFEIGLYRQPGFSQAAASLLAEDSPKIAILI